MDTKVLNISELSKLDSEYINQNIMPSRGNHITKDFDLHNNWNYCKEHYSDFNFQLVTIDRDIDNVWLPDKILCKEIWLDYLLHDKDYDLFKLMWVLNDYITVGWKYPVQAVYNWKMDWTEIHPGFLRGLVYNILDIRTFTAWYQPMTDKQFSTIHKFTDPDTMLDTMGYRNYHHLDAELIKYFDKPMIKLCIHTTDIKDSVKLFKELFYKNLDNGVNIIGPVRDEVNNLPEHIVKGKLFFDRTDLPSIVVKDVEDLYVQLLFIGTNQVNNQPV